MTSRANSGAPVHHFYMNRELMRSLADSIPENKTDTRQKENKDHDSVLKEVPKAHKQLKPVAVPAVTQIKPVQIIKPKIIKPVVRIR